MSRKLIKINGGTNQIQNLILDGWDEIINIDFVDYGQQRGIFPSLLHKYTDYYGFEDVYYYAEIPVYLFSTFYAMIPYQNIAMPSYNYDTIIGWENAKGEPIIDYTKQEETENEK